MELTPKDIEFVWPELLAGLSDEERIGLIETITASWHEGYIINRQDVADLAEFTRGDISFEEYVSRGPAAQMERNYHDC